MERLSIAEFDADSTAYDALVRETPEIDHYCSSSLWVLPARFGLLPEGRPWIWRGAHGYAAFVQERSLGWRGMRSLEAMWCFSSTLVGPQIEALVQEFLSCCRENEPAWKQITLSGMPLPGSRFFEAVRRTFGPHYQLYEGGTCDRARASLDGGLDGYLSRRSRRLRAGLRRSERQAANLGIQFETIQQPALSDADALYERVQRSERSSWKGRAGIGIEHGRMCQFYDLMLPRLIEADALRLIFARKGDQDVGYVLGGVRSGIYRGLQFSFDADYRQIGLGNLLQLEQIRQLADAPVMSYDMGSVNRYKRRWAEQAVETVAIIVTR